MNNSTGVVLDAGVFIALERRKRTMVALVEIFANGGTPLITSAGVVAQVWRSDGRRQAPIIFLLRRTRVIDLTYGTARVLGNMLGVSGASDPVDAHIVFLARQHAWPVLTSDPGDLLKIDPTLRVERI